MALTAGTMLWVEALLRRVRQGQGQLSPDRFIPIAEASDLIIDIDRWVLATVARQVAAWSTDPDLGPVRITMSTSPDVTCSANASRGTCEKSCRQLYRS